MALDSNSSLTGSQNNQAEGGLLIVDQSCEHFSNESAGLSDSFVDLTEEARQEGLNSEIKLNFPLNGSFYNTLRADKSSDQAMHADLLGTSFVINKQKIDHDFILRLCGQYNHLILSHDHSLFAMQIFTDVFKHVGAKIPNDLILKELVTNCNPAGYGGSFHRQLHNTFIEQRLVLRDTEGSINIECNDSNCVSIKYNPLIPICHFDSMEEKICELNCSLEFTLESQNGEIEYTNGKVELIIPKKLTNYSNNVNILIDKIKEHFLDTGKFMGWFSNSVNKVSRLITTDTDNEEQLEFPLTQFLLEQLKAGKNNTCANSGKQSHRDLHAMDFIINDKVIDKSFVKKLYDEHSNLITDGGKKYRPFVKQIFIEMFKHAGAEIPNDLILEELVTNCNQAGYEAAIYAQIHPIFVQYGLVPTILEKTMRICCNSVNFLNIEYNEVVNIKNSDPDQQEQYKSRNKLVFTLESRENDVIYKDGKVELIVPKKLKKYCNMNGTSLLDEINEHFSDKKGEEVVLKAPAQSTLGQIQGIVDFAGEAAAEVINVGFEQGKMLAEAGYKAMFDLTKVQEQEEESMISSSSDEYHEVVNQEQNSVQLAEEEKDEEYFDASDGSAEDQQLNVAETHPKVLVTPQTKPTTTIKAVYDSDSPLIEDVPDKGDPTERVPGAPVLGFGYADNQYQGVDTQSQSSDFSQNSGSASGQTPIIVGDLGAEDGNAQSLSSGAKNDGWTDQSLEGTAEEADKLLDEQERPSDEPDASKLSDLVGGGTGSATDGGVSPSPSKVLNVNLPGVAKEADKSPDEQGQPSNPVDGGAGSATENGASSDGNQSDTSKKSARPYNIAALLLLGGGIGATIAAPVMYFVFYASLLEAGVAVGPLAAITAGVGAFLFIAAAVVHFCKPKTLSEDSNVEKVATAGQGTSQAASVFG